MKKKLILLALCVLVISGCGKKIPTLKNGEKVVVEAKNGSISVDNLYDKMKDDYALTVLLDMIDVQIIEEKYNDKVEDAKDYVDATISQLETYYGDELDQVLQYNGFASKDAYRNSIYVNYLRNVVIEEYGKSKITDKQIESYYNNQVVGDVKVSHIVITPEVNDSMTADEKKKAESDAKAKAEEVIKKLKSAKDKEKTFAELAKEYSSDASTKETGGSLGYINRGTLGTGYSELEDAAYKLKDGEFSKTVITTELGYEVIIRLDSKKKPDLDSVKDSIIETLGKEYIADEPEATVNALIELREQFKIDIIDSELNKQYENYKQNQLDAAKQQKEQLEQQKNQQ